MTSTPIKKAVDTARDDGPSFDASFFSTDSNDDSNDVTFDENVFMKNTYMSDDEEEIEEMDGDLHSSIVNENKLIVFESNLMEIINALTCSECNCPVDPSDTDKEYIGTMIKITAYCTGGHLVRKWTSQPLTGKMPAGNLLVSAATLFSGQTFTHISQFSQFMNLKFIGKTTYQTIQREVLMPVVSHAWNMMQEHIFTKIKSQNRYLRLAGDGRCDSPGFNAKYCTYSLMDLDTQQIVAFVTVQVTETGSSSKMEVEGFKRCMDFLLERGFEIKVLATDRHVQIRSVMSKQYPQTEHQFDVWHLANSIRKKTLGKIEVAGDRGAWAVD
ncbi:hypothetical protein FSP39_002787 [Pinctada imbricata]|uniref:Mutator-like transposase domain-containing protein n=1 Tax=Pinctada imbricata TaxID=66713 RepID=A0AA88XFV3_PINIB|nr:hypothetical protein FSP39_002787 [Pinctada imbricata]